MECLIECLGCAMNLIAVSSAQRSAKHLHFTDDLFAVCAAELIVLVAQILPGMPQKQPAVLNMAGRKHARESRITNDE